MLSHYRLSWSLSYLLDDYMSTEMARELATTPSG